MIKAAAGLLGHMRQQLQVHRVVADADGSDADLALGNGRHQRKMVSRAAVGVTIGDEDNVPGRAAAAGELVGGGLQGPVKIRPPPVLQAADFADQLGAILSEWRQGGQDKGLRIKRDPAGQVGVLELVHDLDRGPLRVLHLLPVVQAAHLAVVAHAIGPVDEEKQRNRRAPLLFRPLFLKRHRQHPFDRGSLVAEVSKGPEPAGHDEPPAEIAHIALDHCHLLRRDAATANIIEHQTVVVEQVGELGRQPLRPAKLGLDFFHL